MFLATHQALQNSQSAVPNIQPQFTAGSSSQSYGRGAKEKLTGSGEQEKGVKDMIKLSPYQKAVKEASKYVVLPYLVPTPDVGSMAKQFIETLQTKQFLLTELAKTERAFEDYEIALHCYLSDAEVEQLMKAHFVIQKPKTIKRKYMTAAAELSMHNFCQSHEPLTSPKSLHDF
ncbi:hypothetical protein EDC04DRAFT_2611880 [Pisolithus marmoratus]|nr:hypothetical protein EDC04DRAFT_2611880 [Pisolithus marmoratus]